jgi:hypothetical protein
MLHQKYLLTSTKVQIQLCISKQVLLLQPFYIYTHTYICICIHMYIYIYAYIHTCTYICIRIFICMCIRLTQPLLLADVLTTLIYSDIYTYIHTSDAAAAAGGRADDLLRAGRHAVGSLAPRHLCAHPEPQSRVRAVFHQTLCPPRQAPLHTHTHTHTHTCPPRQAPLYTHYTRSLRPHTLAAYGLMH